MKKILLFFLQSLLINAIFIEESSGTEQVLADMSLEDELKFLAAERHVVVTASKQEEKVSKTVATTSVITQNDIRQMGARNLLDILRLVPGIGVTESMLGVREIEVRGVKTQASEKVLFMLNGHPLDHNLQNAGSTWAYDDMPINNIKRVEVVRGPGSSLYGANAFLAVVNIITMDAKDINGYQASTAWGSFDTQQYNAAWGKQFANTAEAAINFNYATTNGINVPVQQDVLGSNGYAPGNSQLNEGRYDLDWNLGYKGFKFDGRFVDKPTGTFVGPAYALSMQTKQDYKDYFLRISRTWNIRDNLTVTTQVFRDNFSFDNRWQVFPNLFVRDGITNNRSGGEIQTNYKLSENQDIITGFSYNEDTQGNIISKMGSTADQMANAPDWTLNLKRTRWGIFAQDVWDPFSNLRITVGGRYDRFNDFGGTFNPRMGFNYEFIKNYSLKASYGTAYRAPSFGEMSPSSQFFTGNSSLRPELVGTFEAGIVTHPINGLMSQATYYNSKITQIIAMDTQSVYVNQGVMYSEGVEVESRYDFGGELQGSFLTSNVVYQRNIQNNLQAADVPQVRANVMMNWAYNRQWSVYGHMLYKDSTQRVIGDVRNDVSAYALFDLSLLGKQFISKHMDVSFTMYNLLDKQVYDPSPLTAGGPYNYQQVSDYQQAGRSFFGRINLRY